METVTIRVECQLRRLWLVKAWLVAAHLVLQVHEALGLRLARWAARRARADVSVGGGPWEQVPLDLEARLELV